MTEKNEGLKAMLDAYNREIRYLERQIAFCELRKSYLLKRYVNKPSFTKNNPHGLRYKHFSGQSITNHM